VCGHRDCGGGGVEVTGYFVWAGEEREEVRGEIIRGRGCRDFVF
jgi:hypothetical protein